MNTRNITPYAFVFLVAIAMLAACQTARPPVALQAPMASSIGTEEPGFSPAAGTGHDSIAFAVVVGNPEAVAAWEVAIRSKAGTARTLAGTGAEIPSELEWDGKSDSGKPAPEGSYIASLDVRYAADFKPSHAESASFILDVSPPTGSITIDPARPVPGYHGFASPAIITIAALSATTAIDSWSLDILAPDGKLFRAFSGKWQDQSFAWDGLSTAGTPAQPLGTYKAMAKVRDAFGNVGGIMLTLTIADIPTAVGASSISSRSEGFAPRGESPVKTIDFDLAAGQKADLISWKVAIAQKDLLPLKTITGTAATLPSRLAWNGMTDAGALAPEGGYTALLTLDYGSAFKPVTVRSQPFLLVTSPPTGTIVSDPPVMTPDGKGGLKSMKFTLVATSDLAPLDSWAMSLDTKDARRIMDVAGAFPPRPAAWDGKMPGGTAVEVSTLLTLTARVTDRFGNVGYIKRNLGSAEIPEIMAAVSITPLAAGFSPNGDSAMDGMEFALAYGQPAAVLSWKVELSAGKTVHRSWSGDSRDLPRSIRWDGLTDAGAKAAEGTYTAAFNVEYGTAFKAKSVWSAPFILDASPPEGMITLSEPLFSPIDSRPTIGIAIKAASGLARMDSWSMRIHDPAGNLFKSFEGNWPASSVDWDGKDMLGGMVESAEDYALSVTVRDEFGNQAVLSSVIPVDILVEEVQGGFRILSSRIFFKSYTSDYVNVAADLSAQNKLRLDSLAAKLARFPGYKIRAVGHAVMINWDNPAKGGPEQEFVLVPLSRSRALAIVTAMVDRGFDPAMISAEGVGAADQLVPDSDLANRWRNRRVAFFLEKP